MAIIAIWPWPRERARPWRPEGGAEPEGGVEPAEEFEPVEGAEPVEGVELVEGVGVVCGEERGAEFTSSRVREVPGDRATR
ncbi:MAG TPA: hypothetical protein VK039_01755 [Brevibacterium sp.]|nr:hypothetical protein [Brevibacterium sp.]